MFVSFKWVSFYSPLSSLQSDLKLQSNPTNAKGVTKKTHYNNEVLDQNISRSLSSSNKLNFIVSFSIKASFPSGGLREGSSGMKIS